MEYLLAAIVGIGLAAACGLRAFVPVLGLALASKAGWVTLGPSFDWLSSWPAICGLALATGVEVSASLAPVVSHALDAIAAPVACAAGGLVMTSQLGGGAGLPDLTYVDPMLAWGCALIAGGGAAAAVHTASAAVRAGTSGVSAGLLAPVYGVMESIASVVAALLALVVPVLFAIATMVGIVALIAISVWYFRRRTRRRNAPVLAIA